MSKGGNHKNKTHVLVHMGTFSPSAQYVKRDTIVGRCKHPKHLGFLTEELMCKRQCLEKNCHWFYRFDTAPYWNGKLSPNEIKTGEEKHRDFVKGEKQRKKNAQKRQDDKLHYLLSDSRNAAADFRMRIIVTRVSQSDYRETHFHYVINYVSDNAYDDSHNYIALAVEMKNRYGKRFMLRHVKDSHGNFVTRSEWEKHHPVIGKESIKPLGYR